MWPRTLKGRRGKKEFKSKLEIVVLSLSYTKIQIFFIHLSSDLGCVVDLANMDKTLLCFFISLLVTLSPKIQIELQNKRVGVISIPWMFAHSLLPWIQLDCDVLYLSQAANISAYHLRAEGGKLQNNRVALFSGHQEDVCRFTLTDTHLISAGG